MSFGLRPCGLQGWAFCDGNCGNCSTTATTTTDGYWYHGNGKLGGEFHPNKPNDEEHYGEYIKVVRCKDCKHKDTDECPMADTYNCEWVTWSNAYDFCSKGKRKESK